MDRINGPGATGDRMFTGGDPVQGIPRTVVTSKWGNDVQEEVCGAIEGAGLTLNPADRTQLLQAIQAIAANAGGGSGGKNLILNGDFSVWQRLLAAGLFSVGNAYQYGPDRWVLRADAAGAGVGTAQVSRQTHTLGQVAVPGGPRNYMRWQQVTAASVGAPAIGQRIESVGRFGAGHVTLSLYVKASQAIAGTLRLTQKFGTGGSPSADVVVGQAAASLSTSFARYTLTVDLSTFPVLGKVLGSNGDDHLLAELLLPSGVTFTVDLSDVQLERATVATAFDRRPPGSELEACRRYYERSGDLAVGLDYLPGGGGQIPQLRGYEPPVDIDGSGADFVRGLCSSFAVAKRRTPTMRWWNGGYGSLAPVVDAIRWGAGGGDPDRAVTATVGASTLLTGSPRVSNPPAASSASFYRANWEADAEL